MLLASRVSRSEIGEWAANCKLLVPSIAKFLVTSSIGFGGRNPATPPKSPRREWARDPPGQNPRQTNKFLLVAVAVVAAVVDWIFAKSSLDLLRNHHRPSIGFPAILGTSFFSQSSGKDLFQSHETSIFLGTFVGWRPRKERE